MATVAVGQTASFFVPLASSITFTPGTSGKLSVNGRNADGSAIAPREVYSATTVSVDAGAWVSVEASGSDGTYTDPSLTTAQVTALAGLGTTYSLSRVLSQSGIPVAIPTSGSVAANGALSGITAFADITAPQGCYLYFPANAVYSGSAAGLYYTVLSSTTAGTIYNNVLSSGAPTVPTTPTAIVAAGPGAYTQTTGSDIDLLALTVDANALGPNGAILAFLRWTMNSSANNKIMKVKFGGSNSWDNSSGPLTTSGVYEHFTVVGNRGVTNRQQGNRVNNAGLSGGASGTTGTNLSIDTTAAVTLKVTGQIAAATDFLGIGWHSFEMRPAA